MELINEIDQAQQQTDVRSYIFPPESNFEYIGECVFDPVEQENDQRWQQLKQFSAVVKNENLDYKVRNKEQLLDRLTVQPSTTIRKS